MGRGESGRGISWSRDVSDGRKDDDDRSSGGGREARVGDDGFGNLREVPEVAKEVLL